MYYIILIIILLFLTILTFFLFKRDIISPSFIVCASYLISVSIAYMAYIFNMWNYIDIDFLTVKIISLGIIFFIFGEVLIRIFLKKYLKKTKKKLEIYYISPKMILILISFLIFTLIMIFFEIRNLTGESNISKMINIYRNMTPLFNNSESATSISTLSMQFYRISEVIATYFLFIFINNILLKNSLQQNIKYVFGIIIFIIISFFVSGRAPMIKLLIEGIFFWIILYRKINNENIKFKKVFRFGLICVLFFIPLFYIIMPLIGRNQSANFSNYITFYFGSPVPSLNEIIERNEVGKNEHFGEETFLGVESLLNRFEMIDYYSPYQKQWINYDKLSSNTFTGMKTYYSDFGIYGVIILQMLFAMVVSYYYEKVKINDNKLLLIFYVFFFGYLIFDQYRAEKLFSTFISIYTFIYFVYILFIYVLLFKIKFGDEKKYDK